MGFIKQLITGGHHLVWNQPETLWGLTIIIGFHP